MPLSRLVIDRKGSGEPVVLIHGIGHRRQAWRPMFDRLAERYDVIAVDLAGFGDSPRYARGIPYSMDNACRDLAANFHEWGIDRPHVVGNSLGGAIALELGARKLASTVTALSPAGFFDRLGLARALLILGFLRVVTQVPDRVLRGVANSALGRRLTGAVLFAHPERLTAEDAYGDAVALKRAKGFFGVARAGLRYSFDLEVDVPTTIVWGTKDRILPYRQSETAKKRLPYARHIALDGAGHVPMVDEPERLVQIVEETAALNAAPTQGRPTAPESPAAS
jgi:pimeloyl-ACP methyl ester carboxylesterase